MDTVFVAATWDVVDYMAVFVSLCPEVFASAVISFTFSPVLFTTLNPCFLAILLNWGVHLGMFCISTIPQVCSFCSSSAVLFFSFIAYSISLRSYLFSSNIYLMFLSSSLYHVGILFDDGSFRVVCVI